VEKKKEKFYIHWANNEKTFEDCDFINKVWEREVVSNLFIWRFILINIHIMQFKFI